MIQVQVLNYKPWLRLFEEPASRPAGRSSQVPKAGESQFYISHILCKCQMCSGCQSTPRCDVHRSSTLLILHEVDILDITWRQTRCGTFWQTCWVSSLSTGLHLLTFSRDIIWGGEDRTHRGVLVLGGAHVSLLLIVTLHAWRPPHLNLEPMVHKTAVIPLMIQ